MIKMCVFDVDGTLFDLKTRTILESTVVALKKLQENGIKICVASGRCHYALGSTLNALNFDYVVAVNGAVVVDKDKNILYRNDFTQDDVNQLNEFCYEYDAGLIWKFIDHMYVYQNPDKVHWYAKQIASDIGKEPFIDCFEKNRHLVDIPQSCSIHVDPLAVSEVFGDSSTIDFIQYSADGYDVVVKGNDKGKGLHQLLAMTGVSEDEVIVFGDNLNDLAMFKVAGVGVAMGNAVDEVKQIATYITDDSDQDGIYNACKHFNLI